MPIFDNESALLDAIRKDMEIAMSDVGQEIETIVKQNVRQFVYDPWEGMNRVYERRYENGGFLGSWTHRRLSEGNSKKVSTVIFSDPELMTVPEITIEKPAYGNPDSSSDDIFMKILGDLSEITDLSETVTATDRRDIMDEAIAEGTDWDFYVDPESPNSYGEEDNWWTRPRDYWSPSIAYVDRNLDGIVSYSLAKHFEMKW
ncbi:MAG: hypothetical protein PHQ86_08750 [Dehalococcoidales bacterium]|jgi:hypothetical protein|nr:hypothetical protein [Dehalococcoidales bacterium]